MTCKSVIYQQVGEQTRRKAIIMTDQPKNGVDDKGNPIPPQTPPEAVKTPGPNGGETPDTTERLKKLEEENANYKAAMQEERTKRQEAQQRLEQLEADAEKNKPNLADEVLKDFDQEEVENFKKLAGALGIVYKSDLEAERAMQKQNEAAQANVSVMTSFMNQHVALFGTSENATPEQQANWDAFTGYLNEIHDINKKTLPNVKNLDKKLAAALRDLSKDATVNDLKERARIETAAEKRNADLLAMGAGGGALPAEEGWNRRTPKTVVVDNLRAAGYNEAEIKEMTEKK